MQDEQILRWAEEYADQYGIDWSAFTDSMKSWLTVVCHDCYAEGIEEGTELGYIHGRADGYDDGRCEGYAEGVEDALG